MGRLKNWLAFESLQKKAGAAPPAEYFCLSQRRMRLLVPVRVVAHLYLE